MIQFGLIVLKFQVDIGYARFLSFIFERLLKTCENSVSYLTR